MIDMPGTRGGRAATWLLVLAVVIVATGLVAAGVRVAAGIADSRIEFTGTLDVQQVLSTFHPVGPAGTGDPVPGIERRGYGHLESARGEMTVPDPRPAAVVLWALHVLAPWLLAAVALALLAPILGAARRGDPFGAGTARRLSALGSLLLVAVPGLAVLGYVSAEAASAGSFASPAVDPVLTFDAFQLLPGLLVLTLAGVFGHGAELRDADRLTI